MFTVALLMSGSSNLRASLHLQPTYGCLGQSRLRFSLRLDFDASGVKFSILRVGKTTWGDRMASVLKAKL
ncbi:hypothetical protein BHM03_00049057 [Ensete ventricosum]|nr:hypothetical protein BHM03_00049057 [Ensete ventricosum]